MAGCSVTACHVQRTGRLRTNPHPDGEAAAGKARPEGRPGTLPESGAQHAHPSPSPRGPSQAPGVAGRCQPVAGPAARPHRRHQGARHRWGRQGAPQPVPAPLCPPPGRREATPTGEQPQGLEQPQRSLQVCQEHRAGHCSPAALVRGAASSLRGRGGPGSQRLGAVVPSVRPHPQPRLCQESRTPTRHRPRVNPASECPRRPSPRRSRPTPALTMATHRAA